MHGIFLGLCFALLVGVGPARAATAPAVYMTAASGTFTVFDTNTNTTFPSSTWTNTENPNANLVGGYVNLGPVAMFYGVPMHLYTGDGINSPYGGSFTAGWGGPVPSAILDDAGHTIQADLSALTWFWNVSNFGQGNASASGTWNPVTGIYNIAWESPFASGHGFDGLVGQWTMTGVAVVPEAQTYAQMLAALPFMVPFFRRRRST